MRAARTARSLHVLRHVPLEGPGRIGDIAHELGLRIAMHSVCDDAPVPRAIPSGDLLLVMGGPMGVADIGDTRWPFLNDEVDLLARELGDQHPVLGVCLGAQLMAHALHTRVYPLEVGDPPVRHREVGWGAVTFVAPTDSEPSLVGLGHSEIVLHWHGDTFDLPAGATLLASTLPCPNQMFRVGHHAYGLQFHVELDAAEVALWVREDAAFVRAANGPSGPARIVADTERYMPPHRVAADRMIRNILTTLMEPG